MSAFHVPDMTCGGCVRAITNAVQAVAPSAVVTADLATHRVDVAGPVSGEAAAAAMRDAGFTPAVLAA